MKEQKKSLPVNASIALIIITTLQDEYRYTLYKYEKSGLRYFKLQFFMRIQIGHGRDSFLYLMIHHILFCVSSEIITETP